LSSRRKHSPAKCGNWQRRMEEGSSLQEDKVSGSAATLGIWSGRSRVAFVGAEGGKWIGKAVVVVVRVERRVKRKESQEVVGCLGMFGERSRWNAR
jgi:hypothetical protein